MTEIAPRQSVSSDGEELLIEGGFDKIKYILLKKLNIYLYK